MLSAGNTTITVVPTPSSLVRRMCPPCISTRPLTIGNPSPEPRCGVVTSGLALMTFALVLFLITLVFSVIQLWVGNRRVHYSS